VDGNHLTSSLRIVQRNPRLIPQLTISVFGLGCLGAVSMACLVALGHKVIGVDIDRRRVQDLLYGYTGFCQPGLNEALSEGVRTNQISTGDHPESAVLNSDISMITVGTPAKDDGGCDLTAVLSVAKSIGAALRKKNSYHLVILRSTVPPGTTLGIVAAEIEKASGKISGKDFSVAFNPALLHEGTAPNDLSRPSKTVLGANDPCAHQMLADVYGGLAIAPIYTGISTAEMIKCADTVWHASRIVFANEIGRLCKPLDIDGHAAMDIFINQIDKTGSAADFTPTMAYGSTRIQGAIPRPRGPVDAPKVSVPLLKSLKHSNTEQLISALRLIEQTGYKDIGFLGLTLAANVGDIRESPFLMLLLLLDEAGFSVSFHDKAFPSGPRLADQLHRIKSSEPRFAKAINQLENKRYKCLCSLTSTSKILVLAHRTEQYLTYTQACHKKTVIIDLSGSALTEDKQQNYEGLAW